jgi:hypothetical protein
VREALPWLVPYAHKEVLMARGPLTDSEVTLYRENGFVVVQQMFGREEIGFLRRAAKKDKELDAHAVGRRDGEGGTVRLSLWNHPGDTIYGTFARCESIVRSVELLLGGEVYHYHSKMIMKDPKVGGAWTWHQDYGYWYHNGVLFPLLCSVFIAIDPATPENGCLQVVEGSHRMGRLDHVLTGDQAGVDPERLKEVLQRFPISFVEMKPGDALFFDCNLLHRSDQNRSESPRWSMICCYNAARNDPYKESQHPRYTPLHAVPDTAIREVGTRRFADSEASEAWFTDSDDQTSRNLKPAD